MQFDLVGADDTHHLLGSRGVGVADDVDRAAVAQQVVELRPVGELVDPLQVDEEEAARVLRRGPPEERMSTLIGTIVYALCAITSGACAWLLLRGYLRKRVRLLLWSGLCFAGLTINNILLFIDVRVLPDVDLSVWRTIPAVIAVIVLVIGLVWETSS